MKIKRILSFFGVTLMVFFSGIAALILFPQPLFSHAYEYENFKVYANYEVSQQAWNDAIDRANEIVQCSELYDPAYSYGLFLAHATLYNKLDSRVLGEWPVARAIANNIIIKRQVEEERAIVHNGPNRFSLVYVLVHEMIHCLQSHKYGKWKFNPMHHPPYWKLEGYPEYMGRRLLLESEGYHLRKGIEDFLERTAGNDDIYQIIQISERESTPYIYYKGRLMVEYLMDVKGMSYDEILKDSVTEVSVYSEMMEWYTRNMGFQTRE